MFVQPPQPSYQPVVGGYVLPAEPWKLLHRGDWAHVPLLIGSNADECDMWLSGLQQPRADNVAYASRQRVRWFAGPRWPRLASVFSPQTLGGLLPSTSRMMTALEFNAPSRYAARCAERTGAKAFLYYFTRRPPGCAAGADHGAEVPYVFGRVAARAQKGVDDATDINLSLTMMRYWATFAATGDPTTRESPTWAAYRPATDRVLRLDTTAKMIPVPYPWVCRVAERVDREH
jgi:para-nitrobenzyl esterase